MALIDIASPRGRQLNRLVRRMREAPPSFLAWKAWERLTRTWWARSYSRGAHASARGELAAPLRKLAEGADPFRRDYEPLSTVSWDPAHRDWVLATADQARAGQVTILGHGVQDFGQPMNWSLDPVHGVEWPVVVGLRVPLVPADLHGDIKVPWEVSRLQFLCNVAQAWLLTSADDYKRQWVETLEEWDTANPQGMGAAWSCAMEVAIRAANLVASGAMMWPALGPSTRGRLIAILDEHLVFLRRHPERSDISGNHYLVDVGVTLQLELLLGQGRSTSRLRKSADVFFREVRAQFAEGGFHFEFATNYHRFMTELVLLTFAECDRWSWPVPDDLRDLISRAVDNCSVVAGPGSTTLPLIGDADSGQVLRLDGRSPHDIRYVRELGGAVLCGIAPDAVESPAAAWAMGSVRSDGASPGSSLALPRAEVIDGFGVLSTPDAHVVVRAGAPGLGGRGGHDHSDLTSPVVSIGGRPIVVDPGTLQYTYSRKERERALGALAHNMLLVDDRDPSPVMEGSVMPTVSITTQGTVAAAAGEDAMVLRCGHDGFAATEGVESYVRQIELSTREPRVTVTDRLDGSGRHRIQAQWHFHPSLSIERSGPTELELTDRATGASVAVVRFGREWQDAVIDEYQWSPEYGSAVTAMRLRLDGETSLPCELATLFTGRVGEESR